MAGSYARADANPEGLFDVIPAPIAGFHDPAANTANASDEPPFVLIIGVVTASGGSMRGSVGR